MEGGGAKNVLMEAVLRNDVALSSVVSDWVRRERVFHLAVPSDILL